MPIEQEEVDIAVIGGGAAGYFAAIHAASVNNKVVLLEKTSKTLSKVKVSGGGRCNVTHESVSTGQLVANYPRGGKRLHKAFEKFGVPETRNWFESRGIALKTEADGRVFPVTDDSQTIINCLRKEASDLDVTLMPKMEVIAIEQLANGFELVFSNDRRVHARKVIVTSGGSPKASAYSWLADLGLSIALPIPSLFTFNVPHSDIKDLKGLSVNHGMVQVPGTKWKMEGPLLITHWGFSAPAVIKLSSWAAIDFFKLNYRFPILLNWAGQDESTVRERIGSFRELHPKKLIQSNALFEIPHRLWLRLCEKAEISMDQQYMDVPKKQLNKLIELVIRSPYDVNGKTTFKEEFVTCGGVELDEVDLLTFETKKIPGLFLAGEVLNVDGITGGFNFQHAWTSGYLAGIHAGGKSLN